MAARLFPPGAEDVLHLVDLSGYVFRAYHAVAPLTSPSGEPTHAVFGTVNMLERLIRQRRPHLLCVAMDSRSQTFRKDIYPEYKANRPPPPEDLSVQMERVRQIVEAWAIPVLQEEGIEADDLIATAVRRAREENLRVVIVSADKDLTQLVGDDVLMWDTMRDRVVGPEEVREKFGVSVAQVRDLLALMGDSSDNVPGVPSVGPKTARDLLLAHGSLDGVFAHLEDISRKKLKATLEQHEAQARLSQRLVTLKDDCTIEFEIAALRFGGRNLDRLRELYAELGFGRLLRALDAEPLPEMSQDSAPASAPSPALVATPAPYTVIDRTALEAWVDRARSVGRFAITAYATSAERRALGLAGIALALEEATPIYVPLGHDPTPAGALDPAAARSILSPLLADPNVHKSTHDLKQLTLLLGHAGLTVRGVQFDSLLASYLLEAEARHDLSDVVARTRGQSLSRLEDLTGTGRKRRDFARVPLDEAAAHASAEAAHVGELRDRLRLRLGEERLLVLFDTVELPLAPVLAEMERVGVLVDVAHLRRLSQVVARDLAALEATAHQIAGRDFNLNSPKQLETLLFDELGLRPLKRTKTSRSTDAATLEVLAESHDLPRVVLEHRKLAKLKGTYLDALPELVSPDSGRIHSTWEQAVAATGRLSSTDPNLQNIPIRTELGRRIRAAFVAPPGYQLVSADYSQIELRVLAHLSRDAVLLDAFRSGQDVHARTAMEIFEVSETELTSELRRRAKAVNFGIIYGQGDSGLSKAVGISRAEASSFIAAYYRRYEGVRRFMLDETLVHARESESVRSLLGRRRAVPDIRSANRALRLAAERVAMNMPIQGTAADILKLAMLALAEPVTPGTRMILTVHDELVFEVPDAEVGEAVERIRTKMQSVMDLAVPLVVDVGHGSNWNEAH